MRNVLLAFLPGAVAGYATAWLVKRLTGWTTSEWYLRRRARRLAYHPRCK